jgi:DeoR/GlpR family transcriptional regulator of sugar metabolism
MRGGVYVDKFFIGTDGYDPVQGFSNVDMLRAERCAPWHSGADKKIILTDSSKFNKRGVVQLMQAKQVTHVITDGVPENCRASLEQNGVEIVLPEARASPHVLYIKSEQTAWKSF